MRGTRLAFVSLLVMATSFILVVSAFGNVAATETSYQNPVTAAPPLVRPATSSCTVTLIQDYAFGPSGYDVPAQGTLTPPSQCPAPWSMVALDYSGHVAGRQFDRETEIWVGGVLIYYGTTPEPTPEGIAWHVEKDVSEYAPVFAQPEPFAIHLPNVVNPTYTGIEYITANLTFYETNSAWPAAPHPDTIVGLSNDWIFDGGRGSVSAAPVTLPTNPVRVMLELFAKGNSCDEFWFGSQPDAYAAANGLCGGGAFREIQVSLDGTLAGVVWPFPYIFTGGVNPLLWRPIPAIGAFNEDPYLVDLTPFVGMLADGQPHTLSFVVVNNGHYWQLGGNLLVWQDAGASHTSGALTTYAVPAQATQSVNEQVNNEGALFDTSASRTLEIAGYVDTSAGRVTTDIVQSFAFTNDQVLDLVNFLENLKGTETVTTTTTTTAAGSTMVRTVADSYPIAMTSAFVVPPGSPTKFILPATVDQSLIRDTTVSIDGMTTSSSSLSDSAHAEGVLVRSLSTGANIVASGHDSEDYVLSRSSGTCYDHLIQAAQGYVTADTFLPTC